MLIYEANMKKTKNPCIFILLLILLGGIVYGALFIGSVSIDPQLVRESLKAFITKSSIEEKNLYNLIIEVRLPRILLNVLAGAVLSVVGILMQTLTKNPLAEPYVLGVSSGASAGAAGAIVFHWMAFLSGGRVFFCAFLGSFLAIAIVLMLQGRSSSPVRLVLTGMGVSAFFQAVTTLIVYSSKNEAQARSAQFWITGSFSGADWADVRLAAAALVILLVFCICADKELNLLLLGQDAAAQTGLNVRGLQLLVIIVSSLAVAVVVSQSGIVGFVGLIIPHIMRKIVGVKHFWLVICSALAGGAFLTLADTVARTAFAPQEVPIGIMTAFVGAPVFLFIIQRVYHER